jgi:predicted metal-binding protein
MQTLRKYTIKQLHDFATRHKGKCLSQEYVKNDAPLRWQCEKGHKWNMSSRMIMKGRWCPECIKVDYLEELHDIAVERGGSCLSLKYITGYLKMQWQCKDGHKWNATPSSIKQGRWCPACAMEKRLEKMRDTIENMQKLAVSRGGKCLSKKYSSDKRPLQWQCKEGHKWKANPSHIKRGSWCPVCGTKRQAELQRDTIENMQVIASVRGGKCLSKKYVSNISALKWQCKEGHKWNTTPACIKNGSWCPICVYKAANEKKKDTIENMQRLAIANGGKCLSEKYIYCNVKLSWQCKHGHIWSSAPYSVKGGSWCPVCARNKAADEQRGTIESMQQLAIAQKGKCLSKIYLTNKKPLQWQCEEKHKWNATPSSIKFGTWCPVCAAKNRGIKRKKI